MINLVSWSLGLLDQLFRVLNFVCGPARPKFFSKGRGDLATYYERQQTVLLEDIASQNVDKYQLQQHDISWTTCTIDAQVKIQQGRFRSPLADVLPEESKYAQFLLVEPSATTSNKDNSNSKVYVIMLPATGEMSKGTRLSMARTLAKNYGWSSIILTAAYYGRRKPRGQTLFFLDTVRDVMLQSNAIFLEGAMLVSYFQNQYRAHQTDDNDDTQTADAANDNNNLVCVTGFSFGAAMACLSSVLATRWGADGTRLACASYVGSASPVVLAEGVLQTSIDWQALCEKDQGYNETSWAATQKRLYEELNDTQLTMLYGKETTGKGGGAGMDNPIAVVKGVAMKNDAFIPPRYALELQQQLLLATTPSNPPKWEWLWGGHVWGALLRPVYHKKLVVDAVMELQRMQR